MYSSTYKFWSLILWWMVASFATATAAEVKKEVPVKIPLYQGVQIGLDILSPARLLYSDSWGAGIKADVNLKNKYFPTLEVGFAKVDKASENLIRCTSSGQYFKAGLNIPLSLNGEKAENLFFTGAHYGFSAFSYDLNNLSYYGNYWGSSVSSFQNEKAVVGWIELVAGVRVKIIGPVSLGWTAQYKSTLHISNGKNSIPPFIPGYGSNVKPNAGMVFHLYYKLPF